MTEIPDDVMKAAREAAATFYEMQGEKDSAAIIREGRKDYWWWMQVIARAILAEREGWSAEIKRLTSESSLYMVGFEDGWEAAIGEPPENKS